MQETGVRNSAFGAEYRRINTTVTSDPLSQTLPADYIAQTAAGIRGLPSSANSPNRGLGAFGNFQPPRQRQSSSECLSTGCFDGPGARG